MHSSLIMHAAWIQPLFFLGCVLTANLTLAQRIRSPEVHDDGSVTFRFLAPEANSIQVRIARVEQGEWELKLGESGIWSATTSVLPPGIHEYSFQVDGTRQIDPLNRWVKKWYSLDSLFEVPGEPPRLHELQAVPHGTLHLHTYASEVTGSQRAVTVYTPPGYENKPDMAFPVVYLLHGFGDDHLAWTEVGRAHLIADNLIAQSEMTPALIVMPDGHPMPKPYGEREPGYGAENDGKMEADLLREVIPLVESTYRVRNARDSRAIVGLSMGGGHSLKIGLGNLDKFAWVGAFSAAAPSAERLQQDFPKLLEDEKPLQKLWIACGNEDFLLERNRAFVEALQKHSIEHEYLESEGAHNWSVWRDNYLPKFLKLVFQN